MRRHIKIFVCILLLAVMILPAAALSAAAANGATMSFDLKYHQTDARAMLKTINDYRKSKGLSELEYDYSLEKLAVTRGEELIVSYGHPRPNGDSSVYNVSENIAYNYDTASEVFAAFKNSADHNKNMLDSRWKGVALAHVEYDGRHYWVQLFTPTPSGAGETAAKNGTGTASVWVADSKFKALDKPKCSTAPVEVELGKTCSVPKVTINYSITDHKPNGSTFTAVVPATWTSDNPEVAVVEGNTVKGLQRGTANLTTTVDGTAFKVPLTVTGTSVKDAKVKLEFTEAEFTGSEIEPEVLSVKVGDQELTRFIDYSVQYSDNIEAGTATITITGNGEYSGEAIVNFTIKGCTHKYDEGKVTKEAACKQDGEKVYTCSECGYKKIEIINKLEHADKDKDKKCDVCGLDLTAPTTTTTTTSATTTSKTTTASSSSATTTTTKKTSAADKETTSASKETAKSTTKNTAANNTPGNPDTGDHQENRTAENSIVLNVALIALAMFIAYLVKIVVNERRKTDQRRSAIRR